MSWGTGSHHVTCICGKKKKSFHRSFAKYAIFESPQISPHVNIKTFFAKYAVRSKIYIISAVFSICNFNLSNFKVHGNAPTEVNVSLTFSRTSAAVSGGQSVHDISPKLYRQRQVLLCSALAGLHTLLHTSAPHVLLARTFSD